MNHLGLACEFGLELSWAGLTKYNCRTNCGSSPKRNLSKPYNNRPAEFYINRKTHFPIFSILHHRRRARPQGSSRQKVGLPAFIFLLLSLLYQISNAFVCRVKCCAGCFCRRPKMAVPLLTKKIVKKWVKKFKRHQSDRKISVKI